VPLPETIPVRYTEEEAEYLSVRPVVRQAFRLHELVDMIVGVSGKDMQRVGQILRAGTVVFHYYRYWWNGFEASPQELSALLARFPDPWPERPFRFAECATVELERAPGQAGFRLERAEAARRRWFHRRSLWDLLGGLAERSAPRYDGYSYAQRADQYAVLLDAEQEGAFRNEALRSATRSLARTVVRLPAIHRALYYCPRPASTEARAPAPA
jgi:hypothetical protein